MKFSALFLVALTCAMPAIAEAVPQATVKPAMEQLIMSTSRQTKAVHAVMPAGATCVQAKPVVTGIVKPVNLPSPVDVKYARTGTPKRAF